MKTDSLSNQLRWVVLLLATAVILPTVCLLWFMNQAVKNDRLAVRTRLEDIYTNHCRSIVDDGHIRLNLSLPMAGGILVFNDNGMLTFPVMNDLSVVSDVVFEKAFQYEYIDMSYDKALAEYALISKTSDSETIRIRAHISQARCLLKLDHIDEATQKLHTVISDYPDDDISLRTQKCHAYLLFLDLSQKADDEQFEKQLIQFYNYITHGMSTDGDLQFIGEFTFLQHSIPSSMQALVLSKFIEYAEELPSNQTIDKQISRAEKLIYIINQSLAVARDYSSPDFVKTEGIVSSSLFSLDTETQLYGRYRRARDHIRLSVFTQEFMGLLLEPYVKDIQNLPSQCRIYDDKGRFLTGSKVQGDKNPFVKVPLSESLPGWTTHLYVKDITFENYSDKQKAIYLWLALLVIAFILVCSAAATNLMIKQQRMNRLKNDFIATVTHELKTPLSSMRLLVDTLLEGNYKDEKTATEYLQLVANENKRLSHLIDSFLTFSRMERNKQVFDLQSVSPKAISEAAIEAMGAKLSNDPCRFDYSISDDLPTIYADHDGIVMVLVNLLDNAYKYTNGDKVIRLDVSSQNGSICFAVRDNGIGISKRTQKKIFNRFYQVDSRLSRRAEGCGLGLSIVKFIVDAHKGTITVESTPCKGSVFTVKIPRL